MRRCGVGALPGNIRRFQGQLYPDAVSWMLHSILSGLAADGKSVSDVGCQHYYAVHENGRGMKIAFEERKALGKDAEALK